MMESLSCHEHQKLAKPFELFTSFRCERLRKTKANGRKDRRVFEERLWKGEAQVIGRHEKEIFRLWVDGGSKYLTNKFSFVSEP
jgi:hypothetical protein